ncbi:TCFL5 protein, partial [Podargus strigoides]|nr:TCFL5 protein [Podargus strigoides]
PRAPSPHGAAAVPDTAIGCGGSGEVPFGEQNLDFTTMDISLVEAMEIEYTQLQHMLCSHTEAHAGEGEGEVEARLSSFSLPGNPADPSLHQTSVKSSQEGCSANSSGNQLGICQPGLPPDTALRGSSPRLGHADLQELRMMLLSESNLPLNQTDKMPSSGSVEVPGCSLVKVKSDENVGENKENIFVENMALAPEPRSKPAVRVRLEDKFNSMQTEGPRCQEPQESGVTLNNSVTLIRQPSEPRGVQQQENKCAALGRNKAAPTTPSLQYTYPLFTVNTCSAAGGANPSQAQTSGTPCPILDAAKYQDLGIPKTLSFCCQEIESTKQTVAATNKAFPEEAWIKIGEDSLSKQVITQRSCSRVGSLDPNAHRRPLGEIQNVRDESQGAAQSHSSLEVPSEVQDGSAQRRDRHNRMERDRRRRIRLCCDELNLLVPFCTVDTDKATTLQWTTAFLKYIQERHGDALKQEFEAVFCGRTGRRLKIARSDSFVMYPVQENTHGYGDQV